MQDAQLFLTAGLVVGHLDAILDPPPLVGILDVHVLDPDAAGVGVPQHAEDLAQLHQRATGKAARGELAVEVPQGEPVGEDVEIGVHALLVLERVGVGHEVAAHAEGVDDLLDAHGLIEIRLMGGGDVARPPDGLVGDAQAAEDVAVEVIGPEQQLVDAAEELAGLRALDDAVVVGRGEREGLRHRVADEGLLGGALPLGGVFHGADADDAALTLHEPRHGVLGAERAGIRQADRGAGKIVDGQRSIAGTAYDVLVCGPEAREVQRLGGLDVGDQELARAVVLDEVDGDPEVHVLAAGHGRLALGLGEGVVHRGHRGDGAHEGVADEVGEGHLAATTARQMVVDDDAVVHEQLRGHAAHARGRGHRQRCLHVADDPRGRTTQRNDVGRPRWCG